MFCYLACLILFRSNGPERCSVWHLDAINFTNKDFLADIFCEFCRFFQVSYLLKLVTSILSFTILTNRFLPKLGIELTSSPRASIDNGSVPSKSLPLLALENMLNGSSADLELLSWPFSPERMFEVFMA